MKKLLTLLTCLCLFAPAQAILIDDFQDGDVSDWTKMGQNGGGSVLLAVADGFGGGNLQAEINVWQEDGWYKSVANLPSSGIVTVSWDVRGPIVTTKHAGIVLMDDSNFGIGLLSYINSNTPGMVSVGVTPDLAYDGSKTSLYNNVADYNTAGGTGWYSVSYDWNVATGAVSATVDGNAAGSWNITQTGFTPTRVAMHIWGGNSKVGMDNVVVVPEPATMALLEFGGLGVLIRRRR